MKFIKHGFITVSEEDMMRILLANENYSHDDILNILRDAQKEEFRNIHYRNILTNLEHQKDQKFLRQNVNIRPGDYIIIADLVQGSVITGEILEGSSMYYFNEGQIGVMDPKSFIRAKFTRNSNIFNVLDLDPFLTAFIASQMGHPLVSLTEISHLLERSFADFFTINNETHLVLDVQSNSAIKAADLFSFGAELLELINDFAHEHKLKFDPYDLDLAIALNSPGKATLKSRVKSSVVLAGLILLVAGGGYTDNQGRSLKTDGVPGLLDAISKFLNEREEMQMRKELFKTYKDNLDIKDPDDLIQLWKQFKDNNQGKGQALPKQNN